jgi:hypothetical protein
MEAASAAATAAGGVADASKAKKVPWEYVALAVLGGATVITGTFLAVQWKHAAVGRKVQKGVVDFLTHYGASVHGKTISGGPLNAPVTVDEAVVGTVNTMIKDVHGRVAQSKRRAAPANAQAQPSPQQQQAAAAAQYEQQLYHARPQKDVRKPQTDAPGPEEAIVPQMRSTGARSRAAQVSSGDASGPFGGFSPSDGEAPPNQRGGAPGAVDVSGSGDGDYNYVPPTPPGMRRPPNGEIPPD